MGSAGCHWETLLRLLGALGGQWGAPRCHVGSLGWCWEALGRPWEQRGGTGRPRSDLGSWWGNWEARGCTGGQREALRCPVRRWGHADDGGRRCGSRYSPAPLPGDGCRRQRMRKEQRRRRKLRIPACSAPDFRSRRALRRRGGGGTSRRAARGRGSLSAAAMAQPRSASQPPPDVDTDDCLGEYRHLFSPDILAGRVAFITGGGSGIGFRIAEIFMRHGCRTAIAGRNQQRVAEASKKLVAATGQQCLPLSIDVRQPQTIVAAVDETLKQFKQIDILVNGAAGNFLCPASALSFNAFKTVMDIDTLGTFNTSKVLFEKYFRDHGGVIINITATLSYRGQALQVHAGSAKAAIDAMTRHLAVEWGPNNIRVNSLAPGPITGTEGFRRLGGKFAKDSKQFDTIPLQRAGNKTEIAHSALYLASPLSSYVTGTTLVVDGGSWLTSANSFSALLGIASSSAKL